MEMSETTLLKVEEVAALLRVSVKLVYSMVETRRIPHVRIGNRVRFDPQRLADWLKAGGEG
jgi:excisionase family DNA binding protein